MSKFSNHLKRVIENGGKIEVTNKAGDKLDISEELKKEILENDKMDSEILSLRKSISSLNSKSIKLERYKNVLDDMKVRKQILDDSPEGQSRMKLRKINKAHHGGDPNEEFLSILDLLDTL